ncbi:peptidase S41-like protein [Mucilaginibacter gracilis]|uniref:Peptidase S41-like protein n=1 Tax=Mucilaginibacter gracilis TaxID=423350 RepID=A0A495IU28_9SPHI|nr:S41 family peptidase [Mucilaginibacter gracilis]RKR80256.1 peptidase S41-like protein [Mucilaginibacter gracilis]
MEKIFTLLMLFILSGTIVRAQDSLMFSKKQVADDIAFFMKSAADIHPNLYHDISAEQLVVKVDSLIKVLPDSLSVLRAYRAFAEVTAFINEGHTGINMPKQMRQQLKAGTFKTVPLQVTGYDGKYFIANLLAPGNSLKGIKILAVNGEAAEHIFKRITALKGGLQSFRKVSAVNSFRLYLPIIGITQPYLINYIGENNVKGMVSVNAISESEYNTSIAKPNNTQPYTFTVKDDLYGYLNFKSMVSYNGFKRFCDSVFEVLDHKHIDKLVVDLRENGGGNSQLGWYLLNYITDKPFRMAGESERKVSQQFRTYIEANRDIYASQYTDFLKLPNGAFFKIGSTELDKPMDLKYKFKGKACFLIGPYTFSSANMLSAAIKDFKLATLIGEPTGEPGNDYGELCNINLPQTGLSGFTSTTMWVRPNNNKLDTQPILPDYAVSNTAPGNTDAVLLTAVKWLKN